VPTQYFAYHEHLPVAVDFAVDFDGLPGGKNGVLVAAGDRGLRGWRSGLRPGSAHRHGPYKPQS
jgi:hypothetical protein